MGIVITPKAGRNHRTGYIFREICTQLSLFFLSDFFFFLVQYESCLILGSCLSILELFVISGAADAVMISLLGGIYRHMLTQLSGNREQQESGEQGPSQTRKDAFAAFLDGVLR